MGNDKDFYDIWEEADKPEQDQKIVLDDARLKSRKYALDKRIYIVRGYETFVFHADDIQMVKNDDGSRSVNAKNGKLVRYDESGKRSE